MANASTDAPKWLRPTVDYGPLAAFFAGYLGWGLMPATAVLVVATVLGVLLSLAIERRVPVMPLVTAVVVCVFGGLTLWLDDPRFVKMKPTIVQLLFAVVLFGGLAFGRPLLSPLMGHAWPMDQDGWRKLTFRFACFFLAMAALNEAVWRTQSTDFWVTFKVFGILALTMVFAVCQAPLMQRHHLPEEAAAGDEGPDDRPETG
ncbi:MAG: septation protein A [Kiloniellales bacterium]|nr:septation protein A [Kiloniellales bacterium]